MGDMQTLHLCFFLDDHEPPPGIIFRGQYVLHHRFLIRAYIDDLIYLAIREEYQLHRRIVGAVILHLLDEVQKHPQRRCQFLILAAVGDVSIAIPVSVVEYPLLPDQIAQQVLNDVLLARIQA